MYELIKWNNELETKIEEIDSQHKKLIQIINKLYTAMLEKKAKNILKDIIGELIDYTKYHFSTEENYMEKYNYPGYLNHKSQHGFFVRKVNEFQEKFKSGSATLSIEILNFLKDWLVNHIKVVDKELGKFLIEKGVKDL